MRDNFSIQDWRMKLLTETYDEPGSEVMAGDSTYKEGSGADPREIEGAIKQYKKDKFTWEKAVKKDFEAMAKGQAGDIKSEYYPDWKKEDFQKVIDGVEGKVTEVKNEMPVGNHEIPMKEIGSMKTKTTANPNKGKWRIVGVDNGKPLTDKFYNSKEEAMEASKKLGQIKDSGMKIVQLKDTMKVYAKEGEMPLGAEAGVTDEHQAILQAIQDMVDSKDYKILDLIKQKMQAEWGD